MPSPESIQNFVSYASAIEMINVARVVRPDYGPLGFPEAAEILEDLKHKIAIARMAPEAVSQQALDVFSSSLNQFAQEFRKLEQASEQAFPQEKQQIKQRIPGITEQIAQWWAPFVATAVEKTGLLETSEAAKKRLAEEGEGQLSKIKDLAEQYMSKVQQEAALIKDRARLTAAGVSVKAAQEQFDAAQRTLNNKAYVWSALSAVAFTAFIVLAVHLLNNPPIFDSKTSTQVLIVEAAYRTAIRLTLLTAIGAATTFFLRMARAHFHMAEYNEHRRRVANSMSAFVEAATSPEQRDLILARLVEAVVQFGDSGILDSGKDTLPGPTVAIDAVMKSFPKGGG